MTEIAGPEKPIDWGSLIKRERPTDTAAGVVRRPRRLRPRHRIAIMLHEAGIKNKDIALALGYTESRLSVILNSQHPSLVETRAKFASEVAESIRDVPLRLKLMANEMLDVLVYHARRKGEDPALSRLSARDLLHMAGFSPVKKQFVATANVPVEALKDLVQKTTEANEVVLRGKDWDVREVRSA